MTPRWPKRRATWAACARNWPRPTSRFPPPKPGCPRPRPILRWPASIPAAIPACLSAAPSPNRPWTRWKPATGSTQVMLDKSNGNSRKPWPPSAGPPTFLLDEQPAIKEAKAKLEQGHLQPGLYQNHGPDRGLRLTRRQVEVGNWVQPGQPLMMLVPLGTSQLWIQANYKETELDQHVYRAARQSPGGHLPRGRIYRQGGFHHGRHRARPSRSCPRERAAFSGGRARRPSRCRP